MGEFNLTQLIFQYCALLITILGSALSYSYVASRNMLDCISDDGEIVESGIVSFNPVKYIDLVGSVVFPLVMIVFGSPILFGWSKNIWVNQQRSFEKYGVNPLILLELSSIVFHFFIAFLSSVVFSVFSSSLGGLGGFFGYIIVFNIIFVCIKLCPILPYEGLRILGYLGLKMGSDGVMRFLAMIAPYHLLILVVIFLTPLQMIILYPAQMILNFLS